MRHYVKDMFDLSKDNSIPTFQGQREDILCPHCNTVVKIAVPVTGIDWERVAKKYQRYANDLWMECNQLLSEANLDTLLVHRLKRILERINKTLE